MNDLMPTIQQGRSPLRRAYRSLWILVGITIAMAGTLTGSLAAPPSPLAGLSFAVSAMIFVVAFALAARVTIALERARRQSRPGTSDTGWSGWRSSVNQLRTPPRTKGKPLSGSTPPGGGEAGQIGDTPSAATDTDRE